MHNKKTDKITHLDKIITQIFLQEIK